MKTKNEKPYIIAFTVILALFFSLVLTVFFIGYNMQSEPATTDEYRIDWSYSEPEQVPPHLIIPKHQ